MKLAALLMTLGVAMAAAHEYSADYPGQSHSSGYFGYYFGKFFERRLNQIEKVCSHASVDEHLIEIKDNQQYFKDSIEELKKGI